MMTVTRRRRKPVSEINVVPYIDVMLVLLIIFMVTAPLITQGVVVDLPKAAAEPLDSDSKPPIVASVDKDGQYYLSTHSDPNASLDVVDLAVMVRAELQVSPGRPVVVKGDGAVQYNQVVQLMVLLQRAGVPQVGLMTDNSAGE
ncbi:Cell division and transport-associated protein TolR [Pseudidiomarina indica]|uniref:Tol-Pal system protein TolR n=1 Tax=Pseudidiomarina indica TaxID=1159017 RepID=A0A1G6BK11_9GAMM|nr:protein TolR [Pseudidiomarina indica]SDB20944.1 Cell division and transport-associated protein TolR [Pseudidiomarina indica]